jgi:glycosyltransferase involved in cell wall biosynthesis
VDLFIVPSEYARQRYIDWGIPEEKIVYEPHGHLPVSRVQDADDQRPRNRFGFFGQFTPFKGADVLLKAMTILGDEFDGQLRIHGANLDTCPADFQDEVVDLVERTRSHVTLLGSYERDELTALMAGVDWVVVPSIWWETGPLTVGEAFQHGRPVICSDMGGMSEKVRDGLNGLYFRRGDAESLANVMRRAATNPALWQKLRLGIPVVPSTQQHVATLNRYYGELLARASTPVGDALAHA